MSEKKVTKVTSSEFHQNVLKTFTNHFKYQELWISGELSIFVWSFFFQSSQNVGKKGNKCYQFRISPKCFKNFYESFQKSRIVSTFLQCFPTIFLKLFIKKLTKIFPSVFFQKELKIFLQSPWDLRFFQIVPTFLRWCSPHF